MLGDGDLVAARWTASGTHSGAWGDVAPTGRRATFYGVNIFRFGDDGKVVEIGITATTWGSRNSLVSLCLLGRQARPNKARSRLPVRRATHIRFAQRQLWSVPGSNR